MRSYFFTKEGFKMNIDQNIIKLFFNVVEVLAPIALNKVVEIIKDKTDFDKAIEVVDSLLRSNITAAESTIKAKLIEASEDGEISIDEIKELKNLVVDNVKKTISDSVVKALTGKVEVDSYLDNRYDEIACEVANEKENMLTPEGYLNINAIL